MSMQASQVGLVGPLPPPNGGMAMQALQLSSLLSREGISVEVLQTNAPYRPAFIEGVRGVRALFRLIPYIFRLWLLAGRVQIIHLMANSGWSWQLYAAPAIWIGWLRRTPVLVNYRGGEAREYFSRSIATVRPSLKKASAVVVPSGFLRQVFSEFGFDVHIIPNIVDLETFSPPATVANKGRFQFVIARNLEPIYGLDTAIRAFAQALQNASNLTLKIAGSGPLLEDLKELVLSEGISQQVEFVGRLDRQGVVSLYRESHAMINPSRVDNMPNSVLEALAGGLPVISTNVGGVPYIVENDRTALLVERDDIDAMAAAIVKIAADESLRSRLVENGLSEVQQYGWESVREKWLAMYRSHGVSL